MGEDLNLADGLYFLENTIAVKVGGCKGNRKSSKIECVGVAFTMPGRCEKFCPIRKENSGVRFGRNRRRGTLRGGGWRDERRWTVGKGTERGDREERLLLGGHFCPAYREKIDIKGGSRAREGRGKILPFFDNTCCTSEKSSRGGKKRQGPGKKSKSLKNMKISKNFNEVRESRGRFC